MTPLAPEDPATPDVVLDVRGNLALIRQAGLPRSEPGRRACMITEREENAPEASTGLLPREREAPPLVLPGPHAGGKGLVSYGSHEPKGMEGWRVFPSGD